MAPEMLRSFGRGRRARHLLARLRCLLPAHRLAGVLAETPLATAGASARSRPAEHAIGIRSAFALEAILDCLAGSGGGAFAAIDSTSVLAATVPATLWTPEQAHAWWELHHAHVTGLEPPRRARGPARQRPRARAAGRGSIANQLRKFRRQANDASIASALRDASRTTVACFIAGFLKSSASARKASSNERCRSSPTSCAGEGVTTPLLTLNVFLLLAGCWVMKPARWPDLTEGGAELASYSAAAQAVLLMGFVPPYGWLGTKVVRIRLIGIVTTFFATVLVAFYAGGMAGLREGFAFYIFIGLLNVFMVSQFWQFANDLFTEGQGRRLFPFIGVGQSLGAWIGAAAVAPLVQRLNYTPYTLMLLGAIVLAIALGTTLMANSRETSRPDREGHDLGHEPLGRDGGFELIWQDRYLFWIAVLIILLNVVNTTGQCILNRLIVGEAAARFGSAERPWSKAGSSLRRSQARLPPLSTWSACCCSCSHGSRDPMDRHTRRCSCCR